MNGMLDCKIDRMKMPISKTRGNYTPVLDKPYKGRLRDWRLIEWQNTGRLYAVGRFVDHPMFAGEYGHTSLIVNMEYGEDGKEIETLNSYYLLPYDEEEITSYN